MNDRTVSEVQQLRWTHRTAKEAIANGKDPKDQINAVRARLQLLSCSDFVTKAILKGARVMTDGTFHEIFDPNSLTSPVPYSVALQNDARQLYDKWFKGDFDGHLLRGINSHLLTTKNKFTLHEKNSGLYTFDKDYQLTPWKFVGEGHLKNGDWWPHQKTAVRDGAHGSMRGGICGLPGGAVSIVMNMGVEKTSFKPANIEKVYDKYPNVDLPKRDQIWYCGTQGRNENGQVSHGTMQLKLSKENDLPIRVIRGAGIESKLAPATGFRYDGLYHIIRSFRICQELEMWMFLLERLPGQEPIRYEGPDKRPNDVELANWEACGHARLNQKGHRKYVKKAANRKRKLP